MMCNLLIVDIYIIIIIIKHSNIINNISKFKTHYVIIYLIKMVYYTLGIKPKFKGNILH